jgi:transposase
MLFIGIDVAKAQLEFTCRPSGETGTVPNHDQGTQALVERLPTPELTLIVLEATGATRPRWSPRSPRPGCTAPESRQVCPTTC